MTFQKNILIGAGVLGVVLVTSQLVSADTVKDDDDKNKKEESSIICYSQTDGSTTAITGISPVCPTGFALTPPTSGDEEEVETSDEGTIVQDDNGRLERIKRLKKKKLYAKAKRQKVAAVEKKAKETGKLIKDNKDIIIGASLGAISPIPGGSIVGAILGTKKGRKKAKKGLGKLKFWSEEEPNSNINSSQSFMSEFF